MVFPFRLCVAFHMFHACLQHASQGNLEHLLEGCYVCSRTRRCLVALGFREARVSVTQNHRQPVPHVFEWTFLCSSLPSKRTLVFETFFFNRIMLDMRFGCPVQSLRSWSEHLVGHHVIHNENETFHVRKRCLSNQ